jgi:hypothetical protein
VAPTPDIPELAGQGVAIVVATRDGELRPTIARAWGPRLSPDGAELTLCVEAAEDSPMRANLAAGSPLAVTLTRPSTYSSVQLKGQLTALREPDGAERERAAAHATGFVAEAATVGLPEAVGRALVGSALVTAVMAVAERYDQTPGRGAGGRL